MKTSDISDVTVCAAFLDAFLHGGDAAMADNMLERRTGAPFKVRLNAMKRAQRRGFLKEGVSLRSGSISTGWLSDAGCQLLLGGTKHKETR